MDSRALRYFIVLAEECHFGRAAARIGMDPSPFSRAIKKVERQFGLRLLNHAASRLTVTEAGRAFEQEARSLLRAVERFEDNIRRLREMPDRQLRIGVGPGMLLDSSFIALEKLRVASNQFNRLFEEMTSAEQLRGLEAGRIDGGLSYAHADHPELASEPVTRRTIQIALPGSHRLALCEELKLADLAGERMVVDSALIGAGAVSQMHRLLGPRLGSWDSEMTLLPLLAQVASGRAVGIVVVPESIQHSGVVYRRLSGKRGSLAVFLNTRSGEYTPLLAHFRDWAQSAF